MRDDGVPDDPLSVALVVGGHAFDAKAVIDTLRSIPAIECYPQDLPTFVDDMAGHQSEYETVIFYNYHGNGNYYDVNDEVFWDTSETIQDLGDRGQGILPLHHGIGAFPGLKEWQAVTGTDGRTMTDAHFDQTYTVEIEEPSHSITQNCSQFTMTDETYEMDEPDSSSRILCRTDHEHSMEALAWCRNYRDSRVFCFQPGHDAQAFSNPNFQTILKRAIFWTARKEEFASE